MDERILSEEDKIDIIGRQARYIIQLERQRILDRITPDEIFRQQLVCAALTGWVQTKSYFTREDALMANDIANATFDEYQLGVKERR